MINLLKKIVRVQIFIEEENPDKVLKPARILFKGGRCLYT